MMLAFAEGKIVGAATVRDGNHLSLLFVEETYHRKGIGRALLSNMCKYLKLEQGESYMTVKAAPYAVEFYERIGFVITGPEEHYSGIQVTPMEKFL